MSIRDEKYVYGQFFNFWGKNVIFDFYGGKSVNFKKITPPRLWISLRILPKLWICGTSVW